METNKTTVRSIEKDFLQGLKPVDWSKWDQYQRIDYILANFNCSKFVAKNAAIVL